MTAPSRYAGFELAYGGGVLVAEHGDHRRNAKRDPVLLGMRCQRTVLGVPLPNAPRSWSRIFI